MMTRSTPEHPQAVTPVTDSVLVPELIRTRDGWTSPPSPCGETRGWAGGGSVIAILRPVEDIQNTGARDAGLSP